MLLLGAHCQPNSDSPPADDAKPRAESPPSQASRFAGTTARKDVAPLSSVGARARSPRAPSAPVQTRASSDSTHDQRPLGAYPVLSLDSRWFVVLGPASRSEALALQGAPELLPGLGGAFLRIEERRQLPRKYRMTIAAPGGACRTHATREVLISIDHGEPDEAVPGPTQAAIEVEPCGADIRYPGASVAVFGRYQSVNTRYLRDPLKDPASPASSSLPVDPQHPTRHRFVDGLSVEERVTRTSGSCETERRSVAILDQGGRPAALYADFSVSSLLRLDDHRLMVLTGHRQPESVRIVDLSTTPPSVVWDGSLNWFQGRGRPRC